MECTPAACASVDEDLKGQVHHVRECIEISASYHSKRERFFLLWERTCQAVATLTATAAFSQAISPGGELGKWFALAAALASVMPLVFGFSTQAQRHAALATEHKRLRARMSAAGPDVDRATFNQFCAALDEIEATEPASLGALVVQCQNEIAVSKGQHASVVPLKPYQRALMHFFDFHIEAPKPQ